MHHKKPLFATATLVAYYFVTEFLLIEASYMKRTHRISKNVSITHIVPEVSAGVLLPPADLFFLVCGDNEYVESLDFNMADAMLTVALLGDDEYHMTGARERAELQDALIASCEGEPK